MTCWRRLEEWSKAGVWKKVHRKLLEHLREADQLDWSRAIVDSSSVRAVKGGSKLDRIRRIAAKRARNTMSLLTRKALQWP